MINQALYHSTVTNMAKLTLLVLLPAYEGAKDVFNKKSTTYYMGEEHKIIQQQLKDHTVKKNLGCNCRFKVTIKSP